MTALQRATAARTAHRDPASLRRRVGRGVFASVALIAASLTLLLVALWPESGHLGAPVSNINLPVRFSSSPHEPVPFARPARLHVPALGINVSIGSLGLNSDGTAQVPATAAATGWYRFGPAPGQRGSAVILGHVDSYRGPGVFFSLRTLQPGEHIGVDLANKQHLVFVITSVQMFSKSHFPAFAVYGSHGYSGLQLVTCGGRFDTVTHSYVSNIVVFSRLMYASAVG